MSWTKQLIEKALAESDIMVQFTKADGTIRDMLATRDPAKIPFSAMATPEQAADIEFQAEIENPDLVKVYDLENNGWRSFKPSTVISVMQL